MAMVDPSDMIKVAVLKEWPSISNPVSILVFPNGTKVAYAANMTIFRAMNVIRA